MYKDLVVRLDNRDFSGWVEEKLDNAVESLIDVKSVNDIKHALSELLKIKCLLFYGLSGTAAHQQVVSFIIKHKYNGYSQLCRYLRICEDSECMIEWISIQNDNVKPIKDLLDINKKSNRTLLHEELRKIEYKNRELNYFEDDLETVTQGENTWEWLVLRYKDNSFLRVSTEDYYKYRNIDLFLEIEAALSVEDNYQDD